LKTNIIEFLGFVESSYPDEADFREGKSTFYLTEKAVMIPTQPGKPPIREDRMYLNVLTYDYYSRSGVYTKYTSE